MNPRLFDIMVLVGMVAILPHMRRNSPLPSVFRLWTAIVAVFCFCALVWAVGILPWEYGKYSLYFAAVYVEGLIGIYIAISIPLDQRQKRIIHYLTVAGGVFVAVYCIPEYLAGGASVVLASGEELDFGKGAFIGPLGYGYYHLAMFSGMSCILALALVPQLKSKLQKALMGAIAAFVAWPAFFCGSRTGLLYTGVGVGALILLSRQTRRWTLPFAVVAALAISVVVPNVFERVFSESTTFNRLEGFEGSDNGMKARMLKFSDFTLQEYMWHGALVPFIGAGFYVAPTFQSGTPSYRVGYGYHNAYLFAFEQGGVAAFVLLIAFLISCWRYLARARRLFTGPGEFFVNALMAVFVATLVVAMVGHGFWFGSTMHFSFYLLTLYLIAGNIPPNDAMCSRNIKVGHI